MAFRNGNAARPGANGGAATAGHRAMPPHLRGNGDLPAAADAQQQGAAPGTKPQRQKVAVEGDICLDQYTVPLNFEDENFISPSIYLLADAEIRAAAAAAGVPPKPLFAFGDGFLNTGGKSKYARAYAQVYDLDSQRYNKCGVQFRIGGLDAPHLAAEVQRSAHAPPLVGPQSSNFGLSGYWKPQYPAKNKGGAPAKEDDNGEMRPGTGALTFKLQDVDTEKLLQLVHSAGMERVVADYPDLTYFAKAAENLQQDLEESPTGTLTLAQVMRCARRGILGGGSALKAGKVLQESVDPNTGAKTSTWVNAGGKATDLRVALRTRSFVIPDYRTFEPCKIMVVNRLEHFSEADVHAMLTGAMETPPNVVVNNDLVGRVKHIEYDDLSLTEEDARVWDGTSCQVMIDAEVAFAFINAGNAFSLRVNAERVWIIKPLSGTAFVPGPSLAINRVGALSRLRGTRAALPGAASFIKTTTAATVKTEHPAQLQITNGQSAAKSANANAPPRNAAANGNAANAQQQQKTQRPQQQQQAPPAITMEYEDEADAAAAAELSYGYAAEQHPAETTDQGETMLYDDGELDHAAATDTLQQGDDGGGEVYDEHAAEGGEGADAAAYGTTEEYDAAAAGETEGFAVGEDGQAMTGQEEYYGATDEETMLAEADAAAAAEAEADAAAQAQLEAETAAQAEAEAAALAEAERALEMREAAKKRQPPVASVAMQQKQQQGQVRAPPQNGAAAGGAPKQGPKQPPASHPKQPLAAAGNALPPLPKPVVAGGAPAKYATGGVVPAGTPKAGPAKAPTAAPSGAAAAGAFQVQQVAGTPANKARAIGASIMANARIPQAQSLARPPAQR